MMTERLQSAESHPATSEIRITVDGYQAEEDITSSVALTSVQRGEGRFGPAGNRP